MHENNDDEIVEGGGQGEYKLLGDGFFFIKKKHKMNCEKKFRNSQLF